MIDEKTTQKLQKIQEVFQEKGFGYLKDDLIDFFEEREDVVQKIKDIKFNKIEFFTESETNSIGFTLSDIQVEFFVETGEDEEGPWYEATAEILNFGGEE
ncbi:MAG: hypothetical protein ACRCZ9_00725 [Fusobacteriaceae bacterium]